MNEEKPKDVGPARHTQAGHEISNLERREIQGGLIAGILDGFINEVGYEKTMEVASKAIRADARKAGRAMAKKYGGNTIKMLHQLVTEVWAAEDALTITIVEETEQRLSFDVTRCRYAEMYEQLGIKKFGSCLSCNRDAALIEGFNGRMKLRRTQTIMDGNEKCDFRIEMK